MTKTESMVERVARAIMSDLADRSGVLDGIDDDVLAEMRVSLARAAIEAMKTPTADMVRAGRSVDGKYNDVRASIDATAHYRAMIVKALEE